MQFAQDDPLQDYVTASRMVPEAAGPWSCADVNSPLAECKLQAVMQHHELGRAAGAGKSFVKSFAHAWAERTGAGVEAAREIPRTVTARRSCREIVTAGCLQDHQRDAPGFAMVRQVLSCIVAPLGEDVWSEQILLRVASSVGSCSGLTVQLGYSASMTQYMKKL